MILMIDSIKNLQENNSVKNSLSIIRKNAFLLLYLIMDILDFSRSINNKLSIVVSDFDIE